MSVSTITTVTPSSGSFKGGTSVTLVGTGFTGTTGVTVGGVPVTSFNVVDDTHLTLVVPAEAASDTPVDIIVTNATGPSVAGTTDKFTFTYDYVEPEGGDGTDDGTNYFMDIAITPANLKSGELFKRLDPVLYPGKDHTGKAKAGQQ